jgi:hypothetical protein
MRFRGMRQRDTIGAMATAVVFGIAALMATPAFAADNLRPDVTVPILEQTLNEDATLTFSVAGGNAITVTDPDSGADDIQIDLRVTSGVATLVPTAGIDFSIGDGADDAEMQFTGTTTEVSAALDGLIYAPNADFTGQDSLRVEANDLGHNGDPPAETDVATAKIVVRAINRIPPALGTYKNQAKVLSSADLNALGVNDVDGSAVDVEVALTVTHGTLTFANATGLTFQSGANGSAAMSFQGTRDNINGAFEQGLTFTPEAGFTGQATLSMGSEEIVDSGVGEPLNDSDVATILIDTHEDTVYWATSKNTVMGFPGAIGRAQLDGGGGAHLASGPETGDIPIGTAIDVVEGRIYWSITPTFSSTPSIYSASLDGTDKQLFLNPTIATTAGAKLKTANGLAIDQGTRRLYWANGDNLPGGAANRGISYVSLDDPTSGGFIPAVVPNSSSPRGLALDLENDRAYYSNVTNGSLAFVPLPGASGTSGTFVVTGTVSQPQGVALDPATDRLFWTNGSGDTASQRLKVAGLNPPGSVDETRITAGVLDISPSPGGGLRTPAIDPAANRIYYANSAANKISYASLDGSGGGSDVAVESGAVNSPDGVSILKDPEPVSPPSVSGTAAVGSTLTCSPATWAADAPSGSLYRMPASTAFEWTRDGATIAGATGPTYTPDVAGEYRCVHRASNFAGTSSQQSAPIAVPLPVPDTTLDFHPKPIVKTRKKTAKVAFRFSSTTNGATFQCKLDKAEFKPCASPRRYRVKIGGHKFTVVAVSPGGVQDPTPAIFPFRVKRKP